MSDSHHCRDVPTLDGADNVQRLNWGSTIYHHAKQHVGVGIICSVAYFDPGNWGVDLQAGSQFGYSLLFVVLLAGLFAVFLQVLASRLGCVTGLDLASHCRLLLHDRPKYTLLYRWLALYPLYFFCEIAIISTDLAELLGSAIALCLIFPSMPLWAGVLVTAFDVLFILALGNPLGGRPLKMFEYLIASLVLTVLICMVVIISKIDVEWNDAFKGYIPSKFVFAHGGLYTSVGILGATVMPHSLILGSALATQDRLPVPPLLTPLPSQESKNSLEMAGVAYTSRLRLLFNQVSHFFVSAFRVPPVDHSLVHPKSHVERENNSLAFVKAHLYHGIVDVMASLLGFAVMINSLILILASSVFFLSSTESAEPASLFDAHDVIRERVGKAAALLFALALLAAGQSSSVIATVAGQAVSEGFLRWRVSPVVRRLVTRLIGLIPSMVVAIALGRNGIDLLLVLSQVILSLVLPFITLPLLYLTTSKAVMRVRKPPRDSGLCTKSTELDRIQVTDTERALDTVDFSNNILMAGLGYAIWLVMVAADVYVMINFGGLDIRDTNSEP